MFLSTLDLVIVAAYAVVLFAIAQWVSRDKSGVEKNTEDYFLAGKSLPWGLAIAAYEWQAAIVLIIVAKYLLPIFLKREIYTMPQFLETRYGEGVKITMSGFWIALYTLVNLTAVMWLGSLAVNTLTGMSLFWGMAGLAGFALAYSMFGGLKAVAMTDMLQVAIGHCSGGYGCCISLIGVSINISFNGHSARKTSRKRKKALSSRQD